MNDQSKQDTNRLKTRKKIKKILSIFSDRDYNLKNLLMRFILVIILLILFLISLDIYLYDYQPIVLSKFQYSYYKNDKNLPPGIGDSETPGKNYLLAEQLGKCPAGFCALDKSTGLKRCPDGIYQLIYNTNDEFCTRAEFCDFDQLPYAVLSDGSTSLSGKCDSNVPCRCTNQKTCANAIVSPFQVVFGSKFDPSKNNFTITQIPETDIQFGYTSIQLETPETQICQLNTGFTDRLTNGCDFSNTVRDKLDCQNISSQIPVGITGSNIAAGKLIRDIHVGNTSFISQLSEDDGSNYPLASMPNNGGYLKLENLSGDKSELIYYNKKSINNGTIVVSGIIHLESAPETVPYGNLGFGLAWSSSDPGVSTIIKQIEIDTVFCQEASDGPNFKNMLLCTQENRQPCLQGSLAYNFDKLRSNNTITNKDLTSEAFSRNFCQQRSNTQDPQIRSNFLQDPAFYTVGCYLGNGCNDIRLDLNGVTGTKAAAGKYYPDVDVGGINGIWDILNVGYPVYMPSKGQEDLLIYNSVEPGDFWSVKSVGETLLTSKKSLGGTSTIYLNTLLSLDSYIGIGDINEYIRPKLNLTVGASPQLCFSVVNCNYNGSDFFVNVTPDLSYDIPLSTSIKVNPIPFDGDGFVYYGIITEHDSISNGKNSKHYQFSDIKGNTPPITIQDDIFNIVIFKQFAFSGGNYNTIVFNNQNNPVKRRVYSSPEGSPAFGNSSNGQQGVSAIIPPQNMSNVFLNQSSIVSNPKLISPASTFQGSKEPFKIPLSMYYPVWNPITFQQDCVRCKPNLISFLELGTNQNIDRVNIQYSGKDFQNYEYSIQSEGFCFTSISELDTGKFNSTKIFHLKEPNLNLEVGDMINSLNLQFPVSVISTSGSSAGYKNGLGTSLAIIPQISYSDNNVLESNVRYGIEESVNERLIIEGKEVLENRNLNIEISPDGNQFLIKDLENSKPDGYSFGKIYRTSKQLVDSSSLTDNDFGFYLFPNIGITNISADGKTITTNASVAKEIITQPDAPYSKYIQFCRVSKNLAINLIQDLGNNLPPTGEGYEIRIDKISGGRITNIKVLEGGRNFLQNNIPIPVIDNYDYYI